MFRGVIIILNDGLLNLKPKSALKNGKELILWIKELILWIRDIYGKVIARDFCFLLSEGDLSCKI